MSVEADKSAKDVEVKYNFTLLAKSNTFRLKICKSKENEVLCPSACFEKKS